MRQTERSDMGIERGNGEKGKKNGGIDLIEREKLSQTWVKIL